MTNRNYTTVPFPTARQIIIDAGRLGTRRHVIHGLLEFDVTRPRAFIRDHKAQTGESLSFTAFIVACLAQAIHTTPAVQAYRNWRNQLVIFEDVDVVTMIETERDGVALPHILRAAQRKTFRALHDEIRRVQAEPARSHQTGGLVRWGQRLPAFIRAAFFWSLVQNPHWLKQYGGTVMVTAVGMLGKGGGWGFGFLPLHTLGLTLGGIAEKPGIVDGQIVPREYLCLTLSLDHDIVDGAPAARFAHQLKELVESGQGLC